MKKPESSKRYNILCSGRKIYTNLSHEECSEILMDFAEKFYEENFDTSLIEMEEI